MSHIKGSIHITKVKNGFQLAEEVREAPSNDYIGEDTYVFLDWDAVIEHLKGMYVVKD